jgi:hypothetical protein
MPAGRIVRIDRLHTHPATGQASNWTQAALSATDVETARRKAGLDAGRFPHLRTSALASVDSLTGAITSLAIDVRRLTEDGDFAEELDMIGSQVPARTEIQGERRMKTASLPSPESIEPASAIDARYDAHQDHVGWTSAHKSVTDSLKAIFNDMAEKAGPRGSRAAQERALSLSAQFDAPASVRAIADGEPVTQDGLEETAAFLDSVHAGLAGAGIDNPIILGTRQAIGHFGFDGQPLAPKQRGILRGIVDALSAPNVPLRRPDAGDFEARMAARDAVLEVVEATLDGGPEAIRAGLAELGRLAERKARGTGGIDGEVPPAAFTSFDADLPGPGVTASPVRPDGDATQPLLSPQAPGSRVVETAPPRIEDLPVIARPVHQIGKGGENTVFEHPDDPDLVVKLRHRGTLETAIEKLHLERLNLSWLAHAGFPVVTPVEIVRIEGTDEVGLVLPRLRDVVFTKDFEQGMDRQGLALWREAVSAHGQEILERISAIRENIHNRRINVEDLQFAIGRDGSVMIVDPLFVRASSGDAFLYHLRKVELGLSQDIENIAQGRTAYGVPPDDMEMF